MSSRIIVDGLQISNWNRSLLEENKSGGVNSLNATCAVWDSTLETIQNISDWLAFTRDNADLVSLATSAGEIRKIVGEQRIAVILGFQNTSPFDQDYKLVEIFYRLGVRIAQLTYNIQNYVGSSCYDPTDGGLTRFGQVIVSEMNRVGMLIDLSHVGHRTAREAIDNSSVPVAITHANPSWFVDSPRNKPDEVINHLVSRGGVIGACLYPNLIGGKAAKITDFIEMVIRLIDQVGINHVAIGSDVTRNWDAHFLNHLRDGRWRQTENAEWPEWPDWFSTPEDFPRLIDALASKGLSESDLDALFGNNWLNLFEEVFGQ